MRCDPLTKVWSQTAIRFKDRSDYILYEILNEPHGISTAAWGTIQNQVINAIRANDTKHTIVVGGSGYNSYTELRNLPVYADANPRFQFIRKLQVLRGTGSTRVIYISAYSLRIFHFG